MTRKKKNPSAMSRRHGPSTFRATAAKHSEEKSTRNLWMLGAMFVGVGVIFALTKPVPTV